MKTEVPPPVTFNGKTQNRSSSRVKMTYIQWHSSLMGTFGKHVVSGDKKRKIQRWRIDDGSEVGTPMDTRSTVFNIAVSQDGKCIVSGGKSGQVTVWNAGTHSRVTNFRAHEHPIYAVDVSPDATRIADDHTVCVWSLSIGKRLLGPWEHEYELVAVKFSPDGNLIPTATWESWIIYNQPSRLDRPCPGSSVQYIAMEKMHGCVLSMYETQTRGVTRPPGP